MRRLQKYSDGNAASPLAELATLAMLGCIDAHWKTPAQSQTTALNVFPSSHIPMASLRAWRQVRKIPGVCTCGRCAECPIVPSSTTSLQTRYRSSAGRAKRRGTLACVSHMIDCVCASSYQDRLGLYLDDCRVSGCVRGDPADAFFEEFTAWSARHILKAVLDSQVRLIGVASCASQHSGRARVCLCGRTPIPLTAYV